MTMTFFAPRSDGPMYVPNRRIPINGGGFVRDVKQQQSKAEDKQPAGEMSGIWPPSGEDVERSSEGSTLPGGTTAAVAVEAVATPTETSEQSLSDASAAFARSLVAAMERAEAWSREHGGACEIEVSLRFNLRDKGEELSNA